jgi:hypothetical protein
MRARRRHEIFRGRQAEDAVLPLVVGRHPAARAHEDSFAVLHLALLDADLDAQRGPPVLVMDGA